MELASELAIGLPDLVVRCIAFYPKQLVIIFELDRHYLRSGFNGLQICNAVSIKYERRIVKFFPENCLHGDT